MEKKALEDAEEARERELQQRKEDAELAIREKWKDELGLPEAFSLSQLEEQNYELVTRTSAPHIFLKEHIQSMCCRIA